MSTSLQTQTSEKQTEPSHRRALTAAARFGCDCELRFNEYCRGTQQLEAAPVATAFSATSRAWRVPDFREAYKQLRRCEQEYLRAVSISYEDAAVSYSSCTGAELRRNDPRIPRVPDARSSAGNPFHCRRHFAFARADHIRSNPHVTAEVSTSIPESSRTCNFGLRYRILMTNLNWAESDKVHVPVCTTQPLISRL